MQIAPVLSLAGEWTLLPYVFCRGTSSLSSEPAVYAWFIDGSPVYVGQAENLRRRMDQYEKPGPSQKTNLRLNEHLNERLGSGQTVELWVLSQIRLNGLELSTRSLGLKHLRDLVEAYCIWGLTEQGCVLLNR